MSDYEETPKAGFALALDELVKRYLKEGTSLDDIAAALEEAALQAGDEEEDEAGEWHSKAGEADV